MWTSAEILDFIAVWEEETNFQDLHTRKRNADMFSQITASLADKGHNWTLDQVHVKVKEGSLAGLSQGQGAERMLWGGTIQLSVL